MISEDLFTLVFNCHNLKKYHPSEDMKFNHLGIFQSLKLRILVEKNPFNFSLARFHSKYFGL